MELCDTYCSEEELARRYWVLHTEREKSIITALFCGQFKSLAQCAGCDHWSAKFDPFTVLQLSLPKTEMRALSLTLSYSNGVLPIQCSIRVPADSTVDEIHHALVELDPSFNLSDARIQLGRVEDSNVIELFDSHFRLNNCPYSDLTVFVLPPEDAALGAPALARYLQAFQPQTIKKGQMVRLLQKGSNGLPLTGIVQDVYTDFCFDVLCSDESHRKLLLTDLENSKDYMPHAGDFIFLKA